MEGDLSLEHPQVDVVGGGLAGCEAAYQLASRGVPTRLWEMRPEQTTGAHEGAQLAELVCSNSLGSDHTGTAGGVLKQELRQLGSALIAVADDCRVPAGSALAVDRLQFADAVEGRLAALEHLQIRRQAVHSLDMLDAPHCILATGPLTSPELAAALGQLTGAEHLFFYDAIAPIVSFESLEMDEMFRASRREPDAVGDYLNIPLDKDGYEAFVDGLLQAAKVDAHPFEDEKLFEGCQPIESIAGRGRESLRYGPMRPVGLDDPRTGRWPYAVIQLRAENREGTAWGLVGFQTRLRHGEQQALLRTLPGLGHADFLRLGSIHRNTYLDAPRCLDAELRVRRAEGLRVAGQLSGCEGYVESIAVGLMASVWTLAELAGEETVPPPPPESILGGLLSYLREGGPGAFSPMNANFGLVPAVPPPPGRRKLGKRERRQAMGARALAATETYAAQVGELLSGTMGA